MTPSPSKTDSECCVKCRGINRFSCKRHPDRFYGIGGWCLACGKERLPDSQIERGLCIYSSCSCHETEQLETCKVDMEQRRNGSFACGKERPCIYHDPLPEIGELTPISRGKPEQPAWMEEAVEEFEQNYRGEWRWKKEAPSKPSIGDAFLQALQSAHEKGRAKLIKDLPFLASKWAIGGRMRRLDWIPKEFLKSLTTK